MFCDSSIAQYAINPLSIAHQSIKQRRIQKTVPVGVGGTLADYVPFYFAPRSPMLYAIKNGQVQGCNGTQQQIVHLVTTTQTVTNSGIPFVFTDGHAVIAMSRFFVDLADLVQIDWELMRSKYWYDTRADGDRKRRRQAEFLVHQHVPWTLIEKIGVISDQIAVQVRAILQNTDHCPDIVIRPDWYYERGGGKMIHIMHGNLLEANAEALVNTVNTVGVMGKGIALQFKKTYPTNYHAYRAACQRGEVQIGKMFVFTTTQHGNPRYIINFPTKRHWKGNARLDDIDAGLIDLVQQVRERKLSSIAIPALGCGNGGLDWNEVLPRIEAAFAPLPNVAVFLFPPDMVSSTQALSTPRPHMTPGRAAIIGLMQQYAKPGYELTKLEIQKLAYFLQEAGEPLKLNFVKYHYGPYAQNLHYVLQKIEGHYILGYGDNRKKGAICLQEGIVEEANRFLADYLDTLKRLEHVACFIEGFETPYGMELLATIHWLATYENPTIQHDVNAAISGIHDWNERKRNRFRPEHIRVAWNRLQEQQWLRP